MWVRSQDGTELVYAKRIFASGLRVKIDLLTSDDEFSMTTGEYATKERTIEILNEIHTHIDIIEKVKLGIVRCDINDSIVYQMPKE